MIRSATPADARPIAEVHVRTWQEAYRGIVPDAVLDALDVDERERSWNKWIGTPPEGVETFVADEDGAVVGFVNIGPDRAGERGVGSVKPQSLDFAAPYAKRSVVARRRRSGIRRSGHRYVDSAAAMERSTGPQSTGLIGCDPAICGAIRRCRRIAVFRSADTQSDDRASQQASVWSSAGCFRESRRERRRRDRRA